LGGHQFFLHPEGVQGWEKRGVPSNIYARQRGGARKGKDTADFTKTPSSREEAATKREKVSIDITKAKKERKGRNARQGGAYHGGKIRGGGERRKSIPESPPKKTKRDHIRGQRPAARKEIGTPQGRRPLLVGKKKSIRKKAILARRSK